MKQVWDLWVAHLKVIHVIGRTSALASFSGGEGRMQLGTLDPLWTTHWALDWVGPHINPSFTDLIYNGTG